MFIVSLAIFDIIMAFEMPMFIINCFLERMIGWEIGCDLYAVFGSISGIGQAITNAAIAFDRYRLQLFSFGSNCTTLDLTTAIIPRVSVGLFPARSMDGSTRNKLQ